MTDRGLALRAAALILALACGACGEPVPPGVDPGAQSAWATWREQPDSGGAMRAAREANRTAARRHGRPHDGLGVLYQVRGVEISAAWAAASGEVRDALPVVENVDDMLEGGLLENLEDELPGAARRMVAARNVAAEVAGLPPVPVPDGSERSGGE